MANVGYDESAKQATTNNRADLKLSLRCIIFGKSAQFKDDRIFAFLLRADPAFRPHQKLTTRGNSSYIGVQPMEAAKLIALIITVAGTLLAIGLGILALRQWARKGIPAGTRWKRIGIDLAAGWYSEFGIGFGIGTIAMTGVLLVELSTGLIEINGIQVPVLELLTLALMLAGRAALEEFVFRGLMLNGILALRSNTALAVAVSALFFGLMHAANPSATALSVASTAIGGVMYGLAFIWTRRLWMPWGIHFAWNYVQGPLFGFPVSGFKWDSAVQQAALGPNLLTGGEYGPEGGLIGIAFRLVVIGLLIFWHRASQDSRRTAG